MQAFVNTVKGCIRLHKGWEVFDSLNDCQLLPLLS
jgi:hypothetical protein